MSNTHCRRRRDATVELSYSRRLPTGAFTPLTWRNSTRCWQMCSDSQKLLPTSCEFRIHRRCESTPQLHRVGGLYWALEKTTKIFKPLKRGRSCGFWAQLRVITSLRKSGTPAGMWQSSGRWPCSTMSLIAYVAAIMTHRQTPVFDQSVHFSEATPCYARRRK